MISLSPPCPQHRHSPLLTSLRPPSATCALLWVRPPHFPAAQPLLGPRPGPHIPGWAFTPLCSGSARNSTQEARVVISASPSSTTPPFSVRRPSILSTTQFGDPPGIFDSSPSLLLLPTSTALASLSVGSVSHSHPSGGSWARLHLLPCVLNTQSDLSLRSRARL